MAWLVGHEEMKLLQLSRFTEARIWLSQATPGFVSSASVRSCVAGDLQAKSVAQQVTLEAYQPRGARACHGLLGLAFVGRPGTMLDVEVRYSSGDGPSWLGSRARESDDVRLGLPLEYAQPILDAATSFVSHRFPPGRLEVVEAAHGFVGSSPDMFRRLTLATLSLMRSQPEAEVELIALLKGILVD